MICFNLFFILFFLSQMPRLAEFEFTNRHTSVTNIGTVAVRNKVNCPAPCSPVGVGHERAVLTSPEEQDQMRQREAVGQVY